MTPKDYLLRTFSSSGWQPPQIICECFRHLISEEINLQSQSVMTLINRKPNKEMPTFLKYGIGSDSSLTSLLVSWIIAFLSACEPTLWWAELIRRCMILMAGAKALWFILFFFTHVMMRQIISSMNKVVPITTRAKRSTRKVNKINLNEFKWFINWPTFQIDLTAFAGVPLEALAGSLIVGLRDACSMVTAFFTSGLFRNAYSSRIDGILRLISEALNATARVRS